MGKLLFKALAIICAFMILIIPLNTSAYNTDEAAITEIQSICTTISSMYQKSSDVIRILSYNILSDRIGYNGSPCESRQDGIIEVLNRLSPDVLCLQEVCRGWFTIIKNNTAYNAINPIKTELAGLMTTIFYDETQLELREWGDEVYASGGDYRIRKVVWGVFKSKDNGKTFCVVNTHFNITKETDSYSGGQAMELIEITNTLKEKYSCPIFIAGDFNAKKRTTVTYPSSSIYEILSANFTDTATVTELFSAGSTVTHPTSTVDHIFLTDNAKIKRYVILSNKVFLHISDHFPIFVDAEIQ